MLKNISLPLTRKNPYIGPRPFKKDDSELFFGRDREAQKLTAAIIVNPILIFYAQSGSGKTSLLNAKIIPQLEKERSEVMSWVRLGVPIPLNLEDNVSIDEIDNIFVFNTLVSWDIAPKIASNQKLIEYFSLHQPEINEVEGLGLTVIIFDQFEEIFTSYQDLWKDRDDFFTQIKELLQENPKFRVVFSLREDFIAQLEPYLQIFNNDILSRYRLQLLKPTPAVTAVKNPIKETNRRYGLGVAERLVEDLRSINVEHQGITKIAPGEFVEPVQLQVVCQTLWARLPNNVKIIEKDHLLEYGNVNSALEAFYDRIMKGAGKLNNVSEVDIRDWIDVYLVTPAKTRGMVFHGFAGKITMEAMEFLENQHLIRAEIRAGARWYELTHDRLIEPIQKSNRSFHDRLQARKLLNRRIFNLLLLFGIVGLLLLAIIPLKIGETSQSIFDILLDLFQ